MKGIGIPSDFFFLICIFFCGFFCATVAELKNCHRVCGTVILLPGGLHTAGTQLQRSGVLSVAHMANPPRLVFSHQCFPSYQNKKGGKESSDASMPLRRGGAWGILLLS